MNLFTRVLLLCDLTIYALFSKLNSLSNDFFFTEFLFLVYTNIICKGIANEESSPDLLKACVQNCNNK